MHQQNVFAGPEVTWVPLVPLNPLVHHPAPRSPRFTRTLGPRSWSTLPSSQRYLVHTSLVPVNPGPPFPCPGYLISLLCLFYPILHLPHIPLLLPDLCLPHPSAILVYRPCPPVYAFLISITLCSLLPSPLWNPILSLLLPVFLRPFFTRSLSPWFLFISRNNPWHRVRPVRLAHLAHITSTPNQDATT